MNFREMLFVGLAVVVSAIAVAEDVAKGQTSAASAMFERLKSLQGEWQAKSPDMGTVRASYRLVAGGSALEEHFTGDKIPGGEMVTVYHLDGNRLLLTHYCAAQNQPRLVAKRVDPAKGEVDFTFLDATNLASPKAGHMHNARIQLVDADHFSSQWEFFENGKLKNTEATQYTRVR
jgi:hypothetical protein